MDMAIEEALARVDKHWRAMGVVATDRAALAEDLRADLTAAAADGLTPERLIGDDVRTFARDLATGAGVRLAPYEFPRLLLSALVGASPALFLTWLVVFHSEIIPLVNLDSTAQVMTLYVGCAALVLVGALYGAHRGLRGDPAAGRTIVGMAVLVPLAGGLITPVTMGFALLTGYDRGLLVVSVETAIVGGALAGATVLARWWALAPTLRPRHVAANGRPVVERGRHEMTGPAT